MTDASGADAGAATNIAGGVEGAQEGDAKNLREDEHAQAEGERRVVTVGSSVGLHARPASLFSQAAEETGVPVALTTGSGRRVNAASILGLLLLNISHGDTVTLSASGDGAAAALDGLAALLASDLDQQ